MAGTKTQTEGLPGLVCETPDVAGSDIQNSVEGIRIGSLQDRATCYTRSSDRTYRWFEDSVAAPVFPDILLPEELTLADPGRWIIEPVPGPPSTIFYQTIQDSGGVAQPQEIILQFTGTAITSITDEPGNNRTVVQIDQGSAFYQFVTENGGAAFPQETTLDFTGNVNVTAAAGATEVEILGATPAFDTPVEISDTTNSAGVSALIVRADHVHAHGVRGGGTLHATAVAGGDAGFISGADQQTFDDFFSVVAPPTVATEGVTYARSIVFADEASQTGSGAITIDFTDDPKQRLNLTGNATVTLDGVSNNGAASGYLLTVNANGNTITWVNVDWGTAGDPDLTDDETQLMFYDRGSAFVNWRGFNGGGGFA